MEEPQRSVPPRLLHGGGSVMVWAAISWRYLGPILVIDGRVTDKDYRTILEDHVHPVVQTLYPEGSAVYQDDSASIHTARLVKDWCDEHESEAEHLPWSTQSPDLEEEWIKIPLTTVQDLYMSFPR